MARILVVERREAPRASAVFTAEGHAVVTAIDPGEAADAISGIRPDAVVIETLVPDTHVFEICRLVRAATSAPIIVLSDPFSERESLAAFGFGADIVLPEPVGSHELVARVRALLRRRRSDPELTSDIVVVGPIALDRGRREITVDGQLVRVPRREFEIAEILLAAAGRTVPRSLIVRELWGTMRDTKSLDVQVGRLRGRLTAAGAPNAIVTIRGVGFRVLAEEELADRPRLSETIVIEELDVREAPDDRAPRPRAGSTA